MTATNSADQYGIGSDESDLKLLLLLLLRPRRYFYRRVEAITFEGRYVQRTDVTLVIDAERLEHDLGPSSGYPAPYPRTRVVSVGLYSKVRLPDLSITDEEGALLAPLRNSQSVTLLSGALSRRVSFDVDQTLNGIEDKGIRTRCLNHWRATMQWEIAAAIRKILKERPARARETYNELRSSVEALAVTDVAARNAEPSRALGNAILALGRIWVVLEAFIDTTHVLVPLPSRNPPGLHPLRQIRLSYTGSWLTDFQTPREMPTPADPGQAASTLERADWWLIRRGLNKNDKIGDINLGLATMICELFQRRLIILMMSLGVVGVPLRLRAPNANHVHTFYLLLNLPDDVNCTRLYWTASERMIPPTSARYLLCGPPGLSTDILPQNTRLAANEAIGELQLDRSATVWMVVILAWLLSFGIGYLYRNPIFGQTGRADPTGIEQVGAAVGALIIAAPGALAAALLSRTSDLGAYLTRGIRFLSAAGALSAVVAGFCVALLQPKDLHTYNEILLLASTVNFVAAFTGTAALLPRTGSMGLLSRRRAHRQSDPFALLTGVDKVRRSGAPADSRYRQRRLAFLGGIFTPLAADLWWHTLQLTRTRHLLRVGQADINAQVAWQGTWAAKLISGGKRFVVSLPSLADPILLAIALLVVATAIACVLGLSALGSSARDRVGE